MVHKSATMSKGSLINVPYADEVTFFADPRTKEIMHFKSVYMGKGWWSVYKNGKLIKRSRSKKAYDVPSSFKKVSLFSETSFHSSFGKKRRIGRYGTKDYTLDYSKYKPIGSYKLQSPVKTQLKSSFGKPIKTVKMQSWDYMVLNWIPKDKGIDLQISHKRSTPFTPVGYGKVIFKSKVYPMDKKKQAIKDFRKYVKDHS